MIASICARADGLVEIRLVQHEQHEHYARPFSCEITYATADRPWRPASVYPDLSGDFAVSGNPHIWNQAVTMGIVRLDEVTGALYWNPYLDLGAYAGEARLKVTFLNADGEYEEERTVSLEPRGVRYLRDWPSYISATATSAAAPAATDSSQQKDGSGVWKIAQGRSGPYICMAKHEPLPPIRIPVERSGWFDVFLGLAGGSVRLLARAGRAPASRILTPHMSSGHHAGKTDQELYWTRAFFDKGDSIELSQLRETVVSHYDFGRISYVKLVPIQADAAASCLDDQGGGRLPGETKTVESIQSVESIKSVESGQAGKSVGSGESVAPLSASDNRTASERTLAAEAKRNTDNRSSLASSASWTRELILYYEPYSYSLHGFHDGEQMNGVMMEEFLRLRPTEIACQTVRIGMKSLHHSRVLERLNEPAVTDFKTVIDDPVKLANNCDILRESAGYARERGVKLTACVGMNRPYLWNKPLSEAFVREHPHLVKGGDLDFTDPLVRRYALSILEELVECYDLSGLVLDYMRHFKNQTVESLSETFAEVKTFMRRKEAAGAAAMELKVRIPADQPVYWRAMQLCAERGDVDGIIPSNLMTSEPQPPLEPYLRLRERTGVKVYGCIDGWKHYLGSDPRAGAFTMPHAPDDIRRYLSAYEQLDVDGVFIYQADEVSGNPYLNKLF